MVRLFEGARQSKRYVISSVIIGLVFWLLEFFYQFYFLIPGETVGSIVRSFALSAATLIGLALFVGPLAKLFPSRNYIIHRRTLGVIGFTFAIMHFLAVMFYLFSFDFGALFYTANPYVNPIIFGLIAFVIYIPLYVTSTDWAAEKLGFRKWKAIHRIVYIAWLLSVMHFIQINPVLLLNPAGYLLLIVTALVFISEITAFVRHVRAKGGRGKYAGLAIIIIASVLFYLSYHLNENIIAIAMIVITIVGFTLLYSALWLRDNRKKRRLQTETTEAEEAKSRANGENISLHNG